MQSVEVNLDKLMQKLGSVGKHQEDKQGPKKKKKNHGTTTGAKVEHAASNKGKEKVSSPPGGSIKGGAAEQSVKGSSELRKKIKQKKNLKPDGGKSEQQSQNVSPTVNEVSSLTRLQKGMKESLDGARFRYVF